MPAVSGSPTQIATYASTALDLAGTPDDAFKEGDLAWVSSLGRGFVLQRSTAPFAANNTTLISAFSGNGYWMLDGQPGEFWGSVGNWYIDEANGSDDNDGNAQAAPLATFNELANRLVGAVDPVITNVWLLSDASDTNSPRFVGLPAQSIIRVEGSLGTVSAVGGTVVAPVNGYAGGSMAADQHFEMGTSVAANTLVGKLLRLANGAYAYGVHEVGANTLRTTPFINPTTTATVTPVALDVFTVETPPVIAAPPVVHSLDNEFTVQFREIWFENGSATSVAVGSGFSAYCNFIGCRFSDGYWNFSSGYSYLWGCLVYGANPTFTELDVWENCDVTMLKSAANSNWTQIWVYPGGTLRLVERTLLQSGADVAAQANTTIHVSDLAVFDGAVSSAVISLGDFSTFQTYVYNTSAYVYGTGNAIPVLSIGSNCRCSYASLAELRAAGPNPLIFRGYAAQAWAATIKTAAAADTQSTFVLSV